jgi:hypothetical protein
MTDSASVSDFDGTVTDFWSEVEALLSKVVEI